MIKPKLLALRFIQEQKGEICGNNAKSEKSNQYILFPAMIAIYKSSSEKMEDKADDDGMVDEDLE